MGVANKDHEAYLEGLRQQIKELQKKMEDLHTENDENQQRVDRT